MTLHKNDWMTVGEVARRSGTTTATVRFYESRALIEAARTSGNQRRYSRHVLRRIALIRVAQTVGLSLDEIAVALTSVPHDRAPTKRQWQALSRSWHAQIDEQILTLTRLRDSLGDCIGCGCLSLRTCPTYNRQDALAARGPGPRRWLDPPDDSAPHRLEQSGP